MTFLEAPSVARRRFLTMAGTLASAAAASQLLPSGLGRAGADELTGTNAVYFLDPEWGAGLPACPIPHEGSRSCHACNACHNHDANKMWTSEALADGNRAHPNCKCLVGSTNVGDLLFVMLFGPPEGPLHRDEFDARRDSLFVPPKLLKLIIRRRRRREE